MLQRVDVKLSHAIREGAKLKAQSLGDPVPAFEEVSAGTLRKLVCSLNNGGRTREKIADIVEDLGY